MRDISDISLYEFTVVFHLHGLERAFEYEVASETSERLREALEDEETGNLVFEAYRPAEQIVINSRFLQMAHFRWRPRSSGDDDALHPAGGGALGDGVPGNGGGTEETTCQTGGSADDERAGLIRLYFSGREAPITLTADDPEEVFDLVLAMRTEAFPRCAIVDSGGEEAVIDLRRLVCAEFPLGLAHRGEAQALFEVKEEV